MQMLRETMGRLREMLRARKREREKERDMKIRGRIWRKKDAEVQDSDGERQGREGRRMWYWERRRERGGEGDEYRRQTKTMIYRA